MMSEQQRYYRAYQQGIEDVENRRDHRLEVCTDDKEYEFYTKGRQSAKAPAPLVVEPEAIFEPEPLKINL